MCAGVFYLEIQTQFHKHFRRINYSFSNYCSNSFFFSSSKSNQENVYPNYCFHSVVAFDMCTCIQFNLLILSIEFYFKAHEFSFTAYTKRTQKYFLSFPITSEFVTLHSNSLQKLAEKRRSYRKNGVSRASNIAFTAWLWRYMLLELSTK